MYHRRTPAELSALLEQYTNLREAGKVDAKGKIIKDATTETTGAGKKGPSVPSADPKQSKAAAAAQEMWGETEEDEDEGEAF